MTKRQFPSLTTIVNMERSENSEVTMTEESLPFDTICYNCNQPLKAENPTIREKSTGRFFCSKKCGFEYFTNDQGE